MSSKALRSQLLAAVAMLLVAAIALGGSTFAWFSMNRTVTATNMQVKATSGSSLVISKSTNFTAGTREVTNSISPVLMPSTKYVAQTGSSGSAITASKNLVYVANGAAVDPLTGLKYTTAGAADLYYAAADTPYTPASGSDPELVGYYYDYIYYLAAEGAEDIVDGDLKITIAATDAATTVNTPGSGTEEILRATSILVYVNDTLVNISPIVVKDGTTKTSIKTLSATDKIPMGAPGDVAGAMKVTLRVYIDGALEDDPGVSTYVRNATIVDLNREFSFDVQFDVE